MGGLFRSVRRAEPSVGGYVLRVAPMIIVPGLIIAFAIVTLFEVLGIPTGLDGVFSEEVPGLSPQAQRILEGFLIVVFAPLVETLIMALIFWFLGVLRLSYSGLIIGQVLFWMFLHSAQALAWGFTIAWAFLIFSMAYLAWREEHGTGKAILVVTLLHAANNAVAFGLTLLPELLS
ncbi:MAG: hypothetical protein AAGA69_06230 [Pseudomonadota bacterium]